LRCVAAVLASHRHARGAAVAAAVAVRYRWEHLFHFTRYFTRVYVVPLIALFILSVSFD